MFILVLLQVLRNPIRLHGCLLLKRQQVLFRQVLQLVALHGLLFILILLLMVRAFRR